MRQSLAARVALALVILTASASTPACQSTPSSSAARGSADASVTAPAGTPLLFLRVEPVAASTDETITATITFTNVSTETVNVDVPGGALYNVRVTSSDGAVVFDSFPYPPWAKLPYDFKTMTPGATLSGTVGFQLKDPGRYAVVAYLNGLETPPVSITASR